MTLYLTVVAAVFFVSSIIIAARWYQQLIEIEQLKDDAERWKVVADAWEKKSHELRDDLLLVEKTRDAAYEIWKGKPGPLITLPPGSGAFDHEAYEKAKWSESQFEAGKQAGKKILAAMEQVAVGVKIFLDDERMVAHTECNGHHFLLCFRPQQADVAMLQVLKWLANPAMELCEAHAHELEKQVLLGAKLNV